MLALAADWAGARVLQSIRISGDPIDRFVFRTWTGLLWIAVVLLVLSLATPLKLAGPVLIGGLAVASLLSGVRLRCSTAHGIAGAMIALAVSFAMCGVVLLFDSGMYHRQNIEMLRELGTFRGAALLHYRFGFSSSWFALTASLEPEFLRSRMGTVANGLLMALATLHLASALWRIARGGASRGCWYLAAAYPVAFYYLLFEGASHSPSPNAAVALSLVLIGWILSVAPESPAAAFVLMGAAAAIKLSALPTLAAGLISRKTPPRLWCWILAGVTPLLIANTVTSGFPAFPGGPGLPLAHSLDKQLVRAVQKETTNWGRYEFHVPAQTVFLDLEWIPGWTARVNKPLLFTMIVSILCLVIKRRFTPEVLLGFSGVVFVFVTAPDFRFLLGYVAILAGATAATIAPEWRSTRLRFLSPVVWASVAAVCWILHSIARESLLANRVDWHSRLIVPAASATTEPGRVVNLQGVSVLFPASGFQCWDLPFPCTIYPLTPDTRLCRPERGLPGGVCRGTP